MRKEKERNRKGIRKEMRKESLTGINRKIRKLLLQVRANFCGQDTKTLQAKSCKSRVELKKEGYTGEITSLLEEITDALRDEISAQEFYLNLIERVKRIMPELVPTLRKIRHDEFEHFYKLDNIRRKIEFLLKKGQRNF